jgi:imidazoleglycerol-phosphate dehydratase
LRTATLTRNTTETRISVTINVDGTGVYNVQTPLPFLTHMIEQLARHALFDLEIKAEGDTHIDGHHTTEDLGIVLGAALVQALGDKKGIHRYGFALLPMEDARVACTLDLSGRPHFCDELALPKAKIGEFDCELASVFFEAFSRAAMCNLHLVRERGENLHHIVEISFKALAKSVAFAVQIDPRSTFVPSTKGTLTD